MSMKRNRYRIETASMPSEQHPDRNEDAYFVLPQGIIGVLDGLGGHPGSEQASAYASVYCQGALGQLALDHVTSTEEALASALRGADRGLTREFSGSSVTCDIATTAILAAIVWPEGHDVGSLCFGHAGDCRGHLHREGKIIATTLDHSITDRLSSDEQRAVQEEIAHARYRHEVDPYYWPHLWQRNIISSALKANPSHKQLRIDTSHHEVYLGDVVLLTSDGIHDNLTTDEIESILTSSKQPAWDLVDAAQARSREPKYIMHEIDGEEYEFDNFRSKPDDMTAVILYL